MDKWEKVFKYAVYMAYEIVGYARCPDSAAWERAPMKMVRTILLHTRLKHFLTSKCFFVRSLTLLFLK